MYRFLLPIDLEERRAKAAAEFLTTLPVNVDNVEVLILNVFKEFEAVEDSGGAVRSEDLFDPEAFPDSVVVAKDILEVAGFSVTAQRKHGSPSEEIKVVAEEVDVDLVVMAGEKRSPVGKALFGSVTQEVLLNTDIPVTVLSG